MAWDHNYARIPDEENTEGGGGRKSDHSYARIPDEENTEGGGGRESDHSYAEIPDEENNEVPEPGGERRSVDKTDLTLDQTTFLILYKSLPYKEFRELWTRTFKRTPPHRRTRERKLQRAMKHNTIQKAQKSGRPRTVRNPEMIEKVKRALEEESDARPNQIVNRARNNHYPALHRQQTASSTLSRF